MFGNTSKKISPQNIMAPSNAKSVISLTVSLAFGVNKFITLTAFKNSSINTRYHIFTILKKTYDWNIEEAEELEVNRKVNASYVHIDVTDLQTIINDLSNKISTLQGNKEWLLEQESNIDKQISDILHFIEFEKFSASEGFKLCKALKELRLKRRDVKNELEIIGILNSHTCNNIANGHTNKAISGIENKQYTPRVLTELFENRNINDLI